MSVDVLTNWQWRDYIFRALQDERWGFQFRQIGTIVGQKCYARKMFGDFGVCAQEPIGQLCREFRAVRVTHNDWSHRVRPSHVITIEKIQQPINIFPVVTSTIVAVVEVAWRRPNQNELLETARFLDSGKYTDHGTDRVPHEHHVLKIQFRANLQDILRVTVQSRISGADKRP